MKIAPHPKNEQGRLSALASYQLMDTEQEQDYDDLAMLAAQICQTPIALITLIGEQRQWFKSRYGTEVTENHRDYTFCSHVIANEHEIMVVNDATADVRFFDHPMVTGEHKVVFYAGVPLVNPEGFALGSICVIDMEKKYLSEYQLAALKMLGRQTLQLMELRRKICEYEQINLALEESNHYIQKFTQRLVHDIKNPLSSIMLTTQAIRAKAERAGHDDYYKLIDISMGSAKNLLNYVNDILSSSKNSPRTPKRHRGFSLLTAVRELLSLVLIPENYQIVLPEDVQLYCSKAAIKQLLMNLLTNAVRYNDKDIPEIEIGFKQTDEHYVLFVKDNGMGISRELQLRIFEDGYCSKIPDRFNIRGNGIGLSTVKFLTEQLKAKLRLESSVGKGSVFYVYLPK